MAELVDARDLKSLAHCERAGSSPAPGTTKIGLTLTWRHSQVAKAGACKALIPGSNPGVASSFIFSLSGDGRAWFNAPVLKTGEGNTSRSSNLLLPATTFYTK